MTQYALTDDFEDPKKGSRIVEVPELTEDEWLEQARRNDSESDAQEE